MAIFAFRKQNTEKRSLLGPKQWWMSALGTLVALGATTTGVRADTEGGFLPATSILARLQFSGVLPPTIVQPWLEATGGAWYAYMFNEYAMFTLGGTGNFTPPTPHATGDVTGRYSFGTMQGNLRQRKDNFQALLGGVSTIDANIFGIVSGNFVIPVNDAQFPFGWGAGTTTTLGGLEGDYQDYGAYVRAIVDGTQVNVGFTPGNWTVRPTFRKTDGTPGSAADRPLVLATYNLGANGNLLMEHRIRLIRSLVRIEWTIVNNDNQAHTVGLRWTINQRASKTFYFVNGERGVSPRPIVFGADPSTPGAAVPPIPETLNVFSRRADVIADDTTDVTFDNRQIFRGLDATLPLAVYLSDALEMAPGTATVNGAYLPRAQGVRIPTFETGLATSAYYGNTPQGYVVPPGGRQVVVAYVSQGGTSDLVGDDLVLSTESTTSLPYYPGAALLPEVAGNTNATLSSVASKFIGTPVTGTNASGQTVVTGVNNQFQIFAGVYSQKQRLADADVPLTGVTASLTLPPGLRFALLPGTNQRDVSTKSIVPTGAAAGAPGTLIGDQDGVASWLVEPTGEVYGPVTYQVAIGIAKPNPLSRAISRTITIPATPLVELNVNQFQMVGFPFQFDKVLSNDSDPDTIINSLSRPIDDPVVLYRWVPDPLSTTGTGRYIQASKIEPGVAYFYRPAQGSGKRLLYLKGAKPLAQAPTDNTSPAPVQMVLERGWNMISNPYVYDIPLNYLRIVPLEDNPSLASISFSEAVRNGVIRGGVFYYSATEGGYRFFEDLTAPIKPWQGYWIYLNNRVSILFATPTQRDAVVLPNPLPTPTDPDLEPATRAQAMTVDSWKLDLVARGADGKQDGATRIGMSSGASDSRTDLPKPPPFKDYIQLAVVKGEAASRYAQVLKTPGNKATWELVLESDSDSKVNLLWPSLKNLPRRMRVSITDQQTGRTVNLRNASSLPVQVSKDHPSRFTVTAQTDVTRPLAITKLQSAPGGRALGGYAYLLGINQDATVTATVRTQSGNVLGVLSSGRASQSGENRIVWNGRSQSGAAVPAGSYILEVRVTNESGDAALRTLPITVVR